MQTNGAVEERVLKTHLHEDEHHPERDAGHRGEQSELLALELEPGDRNATAHGSISTST